MSDPLVDTNVIVAFLATDDLVKQAAAAALFERIRDGDIRVIATDTIIADSVYVLSSPRLYRIPRDLIADMLISLVELPGFQVAHQQTLIHALKLYGHQNIKFDDAFIIAAMTTEGSTQLYSWDRGFDRFEGLERIEP